MSLSIDIDIETDTAGEREGEGEDPDLEPDSDRDIVLPCVGSGPTGLYGVLVCHTPAAAAAVDTDVLLGSTVVTVLQNSSTKGK
jgi:hypothetical protein